MKAVLDVCCGGRQFYADKDDPRVTFCDLHPREAVLCDGRVFRCAPDVVADFTKLPFQDAAFSLVVFDPPHLESAGRDSYMATKYGKLEGDWKEDLRKGFAECFRVLRPSGTLVFKWCEHQIPLKEVLALTAYRPLFGNRNPKGAGTHWQVFIKPSTSEGAERVLSAIKDTLDRLGWDWNPKRVDIDFAFAAIDKAYEAGTAERTCTVTPQGEDEMYCDFGTCSICGQSVPYYVDETSYCMGCGAMIAGCSNE